MTKVTPVIAEAERWFLPTDGLFRSYVLV